MEWLPRIGVECVVVVVVKSECLRVIFQASSYSDSVAVLLTLTYQGQAQRNERLYLALVVPPSPLYRWNQNHSFPTIAAVYSWVDALPPKSPVVALPSAIVFRAPVVNTSAHTPKMATYSKCCLFNFICVPVEIHVSQHHQRGQ